MCARPALELAGAYPPNGGAPPSAQSLVTRRQTNTRINFGDVPELNVTAAIRISRERIEWKSRKPSMHCYPHLGETAEYKFRLSNSEDHFHFPKNRKICFHAVAFGEKRNTVMHYDERRTDGQQIRHP